MDALAPKVMPERLRRGMHQHDPDANVVPPDSGHDVLGAAWALTPELSERAAEGEARRTMPPDLVEKLRTAGLFDMGRPRSLGGLELDPLTQMQVIEQLSRADGSAGWTVMIGDSSMFFAWLDPEVAREMIGNDTQFASSSTAAPLGRAVPDDTGNFTVNGRWPFASGCLHATWSQLGMFVMNGNSPRMVPGRGPDWRLAFCRSTAVEIHDTWDALGLRGTGSHDVSVKGLRVPAEHVAAPFFEPARHDGPLWRIPFFTLLAVTHAGFPLGVARRALDEFTTLATSKRRGAATSCVAETGDAQIVLARAEGGLQAARAFVLDALGELWTTACAGDTPNLELRARVQLAVLNAHRAAEAAVDTLLPLAGAAGVYSSRPLQRCFRDIHTAGQHIFVSADAWKRYAQLRLGIDQPTFMI
jgi:indole-3-acetate monooxygenase